MEVVNQRCVGLDVHKKTVVACWIIPTDSGNGNVTSAPLARCWMTCWLWQTGCEPLA